MTKRFKVELKIERFYDAESFKRLFENIVEEFETEHTELESVIIKEYGKDPKELKIILL